MAKSPKTIDVPDGYGRLEGSERRPSKKAKLLGPADSKEAVEVTIVLRRRPDGTPVPDFDHFAAPSHEGRQRLSSEEFTEKFGAAPDDLAQVEDFVRGQGLKLVETHAGRRTVVATGTVAQMSKAFAVGLARYQQEGSAARGEKPKTEIYRGRDGFIHVPDNLVEVIVGVFGLDNRRITKRNAAGDPPNTVPLTIQKVRQLYSFPLNSASGQTIGLFCGLTELGDGYDINDIQNYFSGLPPGFPMPSITDVSVHGNNSGSDPFGEITQDIDIAGTAAPGAALAVYFTTHTQQGWVDCVNRVVFPNPGDPVCSVLSSSYYVSNGDDAATLLAEGISVAWVKAVSMAFQDAAIQGVTICIASGDTGAQSKVGDGKAHVQYPASDPWVLSCGGTTIGNVVGSSSFEEFVWNDTIVSPGPGTPEGVQFVALNQSLLAEPFHVRLVCPRATKAPAKASVIQSNLQL